MKVLQVYPSISWCLKELIYQTSWWEIRNEDFNGLAKNILIKINNGMETLHDYPEMYKKYECQNGCGTLEDIMEFYRTILNDWNELKKSYPEASQVALVYVC